MSSLMQTQYCFVYAKEFIPYLEGVIVSPLMKTKPSESDPIRVLEEPHVNELCISDTLYCSFCATGFVDKDQQRTHYKLDWHRYNLKQHLNQKKTISEERFSQLAVEDDVSSISGSENESEVETDADLKDDARLCHLIARRSRILFNNSTGQVISIHRALLLNKKEEAASDDHLINLLVKLPSRTNWLVVMVGGGHFAAAIFKGSEPVFHKTFHSYTVRAKQGGSQSTKDGKGLHFKSAGSNLRSYNEQSFTQHVQSLMKAWAPDIVKCDKIFYRAVGRGNTGILFSGSVPPLLKGDPRLRNIPFPTRRATFNELKRVHGLLATAFIYDSSEMFRSSFSPPVKESCDTEKKWTKNSEGSPKGNPRKIDRAKERPSPVRELPNIVQQLAALETSGSEGDLVYVEEEISLVDSLQEFEDTVPHKVKINNRRKIRKKKIESILKEQADEQQEKLKPEVQQLWKDIHACILNGAHKDLSDLIINKKDVTDEELKMILNQKNILGETILHTIASKGEESVLRLLLMNGADPTSKDKKSQTPYDHSMDKQTRNAFRRFMGEFPEQYDYSKSHIPSALTEELEEEIADKKRLAKKAKRLKDKERRIAAETMKNEEYEKKCFLNLSDREKRALAAEKRILASSGKAGVVISRCYECAIDITGKVPFEYDNNRFCTINCLKKHRSKLKSQMC